MSAAKKFLTEDLPYGKESLKLPDMKEGRLCVPGSMSAELQFKISDSPNRPAVYRQVDYLESTESYAVETAASKIITSVQKVG